MPGTASRLSDRLRDALVPLLWCLMHTVWLSALMRAIYAAPFVYPQGISFPLWLVPLLLLGGAWLETRISYLERGWLAGAIVGLGLVVAVMFLLPVPEGAAASATRWQLIYRFTDGIPALLIAGITAGILWASGLSADWSDQQGLWRGFLAGIVVLSILTVLPSSASGQETRQLGGTMALFVFCGLMLLALQALSSTLAAGRSEGYGLSIERYWLASLGLVTLAILGAGALFGLLLTPDAVSSIAATVWPVIRIILAPFLWVFQWVGFILLWLLSMMLNRLQIAGGEGEQMEEPRVPTDLAQQLASIEEGVSPGVNLPPNLARIVLIVVVAGALLLIFYLVWRRRGRRRRKALDIEERDSIMSREMFLDQFSDWLGSLLPRRNRDLFDQALDASDPRQAVRLLYRRLLQAARKLGRPRARGQTPDGFARALSSLVPEEQDNVQQVTRRYVAVRYGDREPTPEQVQETRDAVDRVERALRDHQ